MLQESNRIEFKVTLNDKQEKEIVAFLNNREGGALYIGIDDDGYPVANSQVICIGSARKGYWKINK